MISYKSGRMKSRIYIVRDESGMTLIEILAAMVISAVILGSIFQFFINQSKSYTKTRLKAEMQQELRWAMKYVSDRLKLAGNGVPPTCGWPVIENIDGGTSWSDSLSILGSFKSLKITTTQTMGNEGSQVKVDNSDGLEIGDLCVISDGTYQEIFMATDLTDLHIWHDTFLPWNDDKKLDHRYALDSTITVVTYYQFFIEVNDEGHKELMVQTQAYPPQPILTDVDEFQIRFKMSNGDWIDEPYPEEIIDIRMIEIQMISRSHDPIPGYEDPVYGDEYLRLELKSRIIPKNVTLL